MQKTFIEIDLLNTTNAKDQDKSLNKSNIINEFECNALTRSLENEAGSRLSLKFLMDGSIESQTTSNNFSKTNISKTVVMDYNPVLNSEIKKS